MTPNIRSAPAPVDPRPSRVAGLLYPEDPDELVALVTPSPGNPGSSGRAELRVPRGTIAGREAVWVAALGRLEPATVPVVMETLERDPEDVIFSSPQETWETPCRPMRVLTAEDLDCRPWAGAFQEAHSVEVTVAALGARGFEGCIPLAAGSEEAAARVRSWVAERPGLTLIELRDGQEWN